MMEAITKVVVIALIIESVWETIKMIWENGKKIDWQKVGIIALSIAICIVYGLDIIALVNINCSVPVIGMILTGIMASRGANFINDLFTKIYESRKKND